MTPKGPSPLGSLPRDWEEAPLGQVTERVGTPVRPIPNESYREIGIRSHGKGLFHKEGVLGSTLGAKRVFALESNRLVFNIVFAWEGAVAVTSAAETGMIASHRFPMLRGLPDRADVDFLRRFFQTELGVRLLGEASPGGAGRNRTLGQTLLAQLPVPVPPLGEQRKIAAILSSVDDAIEATQAVIEQLQVVKKAMMAELLTRGLPGRHTRFKQTELGVLPESWDVARVGDVGTVAYGLTVNAQRRASTTTQLYLTVANVQDEGFDLRTVKTIGSLPGDADRYQLKAGDTLIVEGNANPDRVGRAFVWNDELPCVLHQNHLLRVRARVGSIEPRWLVLAINSAAGRRQVLDHAKSSSGLHTINSKVVGDIRVPVPPIYEQRSIVDVHSSIEGRLARERGTLHAIVAMKHALMAVLLTGEVRVQPDEAPA